MTPIVIDTSDSDDPLACVVAPRRKKYNKHDPNSGPRDDEDASADQHLPAPRPQSHLLRPLDSSDKALGSTRLREYLSRPTSADPILLRESHRESPIPDMLAGSSNSTRNSDVNRAAHMALAMDSEIYRIPNRSHDRPRRILFEPHDASALTISRHGYIDRFDSNPFRYNQLLRSPAHPSLEVVEDACFLTISGRSVIVLAHARDEKQITIASLGHGRYANIHFLERPSSSVKKGGASAVAAMMQPRMFASGGHDHAVHLWTLSDDLRSAEPRLLAMRHTALVQSLLAIRDTSHKLISAGADCNVHLWDLSSERVVNTIKASNSVYHVHKTPSPFCTLLEVAHRELQFEVRDHRLVPENPVQRFGYRTDTVHGRFIKGDSQSHLFACGDREGTIRLWDLRNTNGTPATIDCFQGQKVAHCVFTQSKLLGCSEDRQFASVKYFSVD
ncbi:hypothetical protein PLICRDRAFT_48300 [Plicaturopsis crispa FD-325 SS-3]|nr:hypothetical protein PLICRDRAFT_48300 [Plicaturopsis crispa FD-325 SS-3]